MVIAQRYLIAYNLGRDSWINYSINNLDDPNRPFDFSKCDSWKKIVDYNKSRFKS